MQEMTRLPLAVTGGDPAGIGLEIALKAWTARRELGLLPFVLFADGAAVAAGAQRLGLAVPSRVLTRLAETDGVFDTALPIMHVPQAVPSVPGTPDPHNGAAVVAAIEQATAAVMAGEASALVTCPIAKNVLYASGFRYPGHTEFLAALAQRLAPGAPHTPVMILVCDELRVVPLTIHVPLATVPRLITAELIVTTAHITARALIQDFAISRPRLAIAGLNPHAGEGGTIGREDLDIIAPAIARLRADGLSVTGPHSADTLFHAAARAGYDAVIAMYHDQALIPIKTLAFDRGVNMTIGLPFVRTSPDHGTAFDIAGRGVARADSFIEALQLASAAAARRAGQPS
jgi:4-hydroxythreonine-4-phosphate dehydrogenase